MTRTNSLNEKPQVMLDSETCWTAFSRRDRAQDGLFVGAVLTTGIYCKPSCPARRPRRENMRFYVDGAAARLDGFRPCLRCKPDEVARDTVAVEAAKAFIRQHDGISTLNDLADHVGYAPHHFHRIFKRETGLTPAAFGRLQRADRFKAALGKETTVTEAIYAAGYNTSSRAYVDAERHLGMTPSAWRDGGKGETIRCVIRNTMIGPMLVAATQKGLVRVSFDEAMEDLQARFPNARCEAGDKRLNDWADQINVMIETSKPTDIPLDVGGTVFQQAVWAALRDIPVGETRSYSDIAQAVGKPKATRAAGTACGDNGLAVIIPCHRVLRSDGKLGGYAYGLERKKTLLEREAKARQ